MSKNKNCNRAFTLIEVLVTISIVAIISAVVSYGYRKFNDSIAINNASKEMAITIRKMQVYGSSGKESSQGNRDFSSPYGIHVTSTDTNNYYTFVDMGDVNNIGRANHKYEGDTTCDVVNTECLKKIALPSDVVISDFCAMPIGGLMPVCLSNSAVVSMDISFQRPSQNAEIRMIVPGGADYSNNSGTVRFRFGYVVMRSALGVYNVVQIDSTGQTLVN